MATPQMKGVSSALRHHRTDVAVVDPQRSGHHQRGEDAGLRQPGDGRVLEPGQVGAAVVSGRLRRRPVVLQVDLHPVPVRLDEVQQLVVGGEQQAIGVQHDPDDRPACQFVQQFRQLRVERRLSAGQHEHVQAVRLAGEPRVHVGQDLGQRRHTGQCGTGRGEARRALEVAVFGDVRRSGCTCAGCGRPGARTRKPPASDGSCPRDRERAPSSAPATARGSAGS